MKLVFDKIKTKADSIQISLDGGKSYQTYNVQDLLENGIQLSDTQSYDKIKVQGEQVQLQDINVVTTLDIHIEPVDLTTNTDTNTNFLNSITHLTIPDGITDLTYRNYNDPWNGGGAIKNIQK